MTETTDKPLPSNLVIRAPRAEDLDSVVELLACPGVRRGTLQLPFPQADAKRPWLVEHKPGVTKLVASIGGRVVGSAGLNRLSDRRAHVGAIGMSVHDEWTGRGIGTALLRALVDVADDWLGLRRLELTVFTDNIPAIALYRRFGFEEEGRLRAFAFREGRDADAFTMARLRRHLDG